MQIKRSQLVKLIRESLRGNRLLLERKTDEVYRKFVDFVYNEIILKATNVMKVGGVCVSMYDWEDPIDPSPKAASLIKKTKKYARGANTNFPALFFEMPSKSEKQFYNDLYEIYELKYIRSLEDVIFDHEPSTFRYFMSSFTISIVAYSPAVGPGGRAAGTMSPTGDLTLYYNPMPIDAIRSKTNEAVPEQFTYKSLEYVAKNDSLDLLEAGQPLQGFVIKNAEDVRNTLEHEVVHYINSIRAGGRAYRAKGGKKQFDVTAQEYVDSTEEIQARLIPAQNEFLRSPLTTTNIEGEELDTPHLTLKGELLTDLKRGDRQAFILKFINNMYNRYGGERFNWKSHSKENQQRLMNRAYEFLQEVEKSKEYKNFVPDDYTDLPKASEWTPPFPDFD